MNALDNLAKQALSNAGAQCGNCGDEPGDRICLACERCYEQYVAALRAAGWVPRSEVLFEAADHFSQFPTNTARQLRGMAEQADPRCLTCKGDGGDPEDPGDWDSTVGMHNPTTGGPCPKCNGTGLKPAP